MTAISDLNAVSTFRVGGAAGTLYPCLGVTQRREVVPADRPGEPGAGARRRITWTIRSAAEADGSDPALIHDLQRTVIADLERPGDRIELFENNAAPPLTMNARGEAGGPSAGYPRVRVTFDEPGSVGAFQRFTAVCETVELVPDATGVVVDQRSIETAIGWDTGDVTISGSGHVELDPAGGQTAQAFALAIIAAALAARINATGIFDSRTKKGADDFVCDWSYTDAPPATGGSFTGSIIGQTNVRVSVSGDRAVETVTEGSFTSRTNQAGALAAARAQRPAVGPDEAITDEELTGPSDPAGRVGFRYVVSKGQSFPSIFSPTAVILRFKETVAVAGGGRDIGAVAFLGRDPQLVVTAPAPIVYTVTQSMTYIDPTGADEPDPGLPAGLDTANESGAPERTPGADGRVRTLVIRRRFVYASAPPTDPIGRTVDFIGSGL